MWHSHILCVVVQADAWCNTLISGSIRLKTANLCGSRWEEVRKYVFCNIEEPTLHWERKRRHRSVISPELSSESVQTLAVPVQTLLCLSELHVNVPELALDQRTLHAQHGAHHLQPGDGGGDKTNTRGENTEMRCDFQPPISVCGILILISEPAKGHTGARSQQTGCRPHYGSRAVHGAGT